MDAWAAPAGGWMHLSCIVFSPLTLGFPSIVFSPLTQSISSPSLLISQCSYPFSALSQTFLLLSFLVVQKCKYNVSVCLCLRLFDIDCLA